MPGASPTFVPGAGSVQVVQVSVGGAQRGLAAVQRRRVPRLPRRGPGHVAAVAGGGAGHVAGARVQDGDVVRVREVAAGGGGGAEH